MSDSNKRFKIEYTPSKLQQERTDILNRIEEIENERELHIYLWQDGKKIEIIGEHGETLELTEEVVHKYVNAATVQEFLDAEALVQEEINDFWNGLDNKAREIAQERIDEHTRIDMKKGVCDIFLPKRS